MILQSHELHATLKKIALWSSDDYTRENLTGFYVDNEEAKTRFVSTNGHGLLTIQLETKMDAPSFCVSGKSLKKLLHMLNMNASSKNAVPVEWLKPELPTIDGDDFKLTLAFDFPEWRRVVPPRSETAPPRKGISTEYLCTLPAIFDKAVEMEVGEDLVSPFVFRGRTKEYLDAMLVLMPCRV